MLPRLQAVAVRERVQRFPVVERLVAIERRRVDDRAERAEGDDDAQRGRTSFLSYQLNIEKLHLCHQNYIPLQFLVQAHICYHLV